MGSHHLDHPLFNLFSGVEVLTHAQTLKALKASHPLSDSDLWVRKAQADTNLRGPSLAAVRPGPSESAKAVNDVLTLRFVLI